MNKGAVIQRSTPSLQTASWQQQLQQAFRSVSELCEFLELDSETIKQSCAAANIWQLRVPQGFAACMEKGNPDDPLLRQVLPQAEELQQHAGFISDPLQEQQQSPAKGIVHKYHGRALLIAASECAVHCRYCFRREFDYAEHLLDPVQGAAHFASDSTTASELVAAMSRQLPGYLVPKLVREQAGLGAKQPIAVTID